MVKTVCLLAILFGLSTVSHSQVTNMTIRLDALGACNSTSSFRVGDQCQFRLTIMVPSGVSTNLLVEIDSSDNNSNIVAQICRPSISWGSNYNLTNAPYPRMFSSSNSSQFDVVTIDFGWVRNSGILSDANSNSIILFFNALIISNGQTNGQIMWITTSVDYYMETEIWVGQAGLTFLSNTPVQTGTATFSAGSSIDNVAVGSFGSFTATLQIPSSRYHYITLTASSSPLTNNPITVCSIHVQTTGFCYSCLDSVKANVFSAAAKDGNSATLDLGYVPNIGFNENNSTNANAFIAIVVTYRASETAMIGTTGPVTGITLTARVGFPFASNVTATFVHTPTVVPLGVQLAAPTPNVTALISSTPVRIHQAFNISIIIQLPASFNNRMQVDVIPTQGTSDGSLRVKVCSVVVTYSGENAPCPKCMNNGMLLPYVQNSSVSNFPDSFSYYISSVRNLNLRTVADDPNVNNVTVSIIGQVLEHPQNTLGSNITIPIGITMGNQTIWIGEGNVVVGGPANYSNTINATLPSFSMSVADTYGYTAAIGQPRAIYLDIYTKPGSVYQPMQVEVVMPETLLGNNIPAATVCSVRMYYVGVYSVCAQPTYINDYHISYLSRMIQFKNDKAIVTLPSLCNSADPNQPMDLIDGLVRFLIYFSLHDDPSLPTQNYIGATVDIDPDTVFVGQLQFTTGGALPNASLGGPTLYGYRNTSTSNSSAAGRSFNVINYVFKIPPSSLFGYNFQTTLTKTGLTAGDVAFCTIHLTHSGRNVPCSSPLEHNYGYSTNQVRISDYAFGGPICSINNLTTSVNQTEFWDDDSVNLMIVTRPSSTSSGSYQVNLAIFDGFNNISDLASPPSFTINTVPFSGTLATPQTSQMNSSVFSVDPSNSTSLVYSYYHYQYLYKGQTSIIRYNITLLDGLYYQLGMSFASSLAPDSFQIVRFLVSNVGINFPCVPGTTVNYINGTSYPYSASVIIDEVAYYPIAPDNLTASTITFEAHVRIPLSSSLSSTATFTFTPTFNGVSEPSLARTTSALQIDSVPAGFTSIIDPNTEVWATLSTPSFGIRQSASFTFRLTIPPFSNLRTVLYFSCQDRVTGRIACNINSVFIKSMGRNVDGLWAEYNYGLMKPYYYRNSSSDNFYNDTAVFDLGMITNTAYSLKLGNYRPNDDDILLTCNFLVTDDQIANHSRNFSVRVRSEYNSGQSRQDNSQSFTITRTGSEAPSLLLTASFLNATNVVFNTNDNVLIKFNLTHDLNSNAEAYSVSVVFYFPPYVTFNGIVSTNTSFATGNLDTAYYFNMDRLHFGEEAVCIFSVLIDSAALYASYLQTYGQQPPSMLKIPYNVIYSRLPRFSPISNTNNLFASQLNTIEYTPPTVPISSYSGPANPLLAGGLGTLISTTTQSCRISSSVKGSGLTISASSITWTSRYRSKYWYNSGGSFLQIAFGAPTTISAIQISQLASSAVPFNSFQVSFSTGGAAYAFLPVATPPSVTLGSTFNYSMPNGFITCGFLRIHILDVVTPSSLNSLPTGLIVNEIFGESTTPYASSEAAACPAPTTNGMYSPQTYLYSPALQMLFVCDENLNRTGSDCFSSSDATPDTWLVMPRVVSMVAFWVRDTNPPNPPVDYLYGLAADETNFVRSDDLGFSWKAISPNEFSAMQNNLANGGRYSGASATPYTPGGFTNVPGSSWSINIDGVAYSGTRYFDWFN